MASQVDKLVTIHFLLKNYKLPIIIRKPKWEEYHYFVINEVVGEKVKGVAFRHNKKFEPFLNIDHNFKITDRVELYGNNERLVVSDIAESSSNKNEVLQQSMEQTDVKESQQEKNTQTIPKDVQQQKPIYNVKQKSQHIIIQAVLLTKSGKKGGACVAAYDMYERKFVRFVSDAETGAEIPFCDLKGISEMDIVEVESIQSCPIGPQTENILVKSNSIKKIGRYFGSIEDIRLEVLYPDKASILDTVDNRLFTVDRLKHSLELISVKDLQLMRIKKYDGSYTTRADFIYKGNRYTDYRVTDFNYDLRKTEDSKKIIPDADLVISIPKDSYIYNGKNKGYYKFIAAIYPVNKSISVSNKSDRQSLEQVTKKTVSEGRQHMRDIVPGARQKSYEPWTSEEETKLIHEYNAKMSIKDIAIEHERSEGAIRARLKKLGLID